VLTEAARRENLGAERRAADKGAPGYGAAERTLAGEHRSAS